MILSLPMQQNLGPKSAKFRYKSKSLFLNFETYATAYSNSMIHQVVNVFTHIFFYIV